MKNYDRGQLVHLLPLNSVKMHKDYFHLSRDDKKDMVGMWLHSRKAAEVLAISASTSAAMTHRQGHEGSNRGSHRGFTVKAAGATEEPQALGRTPPDGVSLFKFTASAVWPSLLLCWLTLGKPRLTFSQKQT